MDYLERLLLAAAALTASAEEETPEALPQTAVPAGRGSGQGLTGQTEGPEALEQATDAEPEREKVSETQTAQASGTDRKAETGAARTYAALMQMRAAALAAEDGGLTAKTASLGHGSGAAAGGTAWSTLESAGTANDAVFSGGAGAGTRKDGFAAAGPSGGNAAWAASGATAAFQTDMAAISRFFERDARRYGEE